MVGKENIVPGHKPAIQDRPTSKDKSEEDRIRGTVMVKRTARLAVMAKSSCAVSLLPRVVEADTGIMPMPLKATADEIKAKNALLGDLTLGIVPFKEGHAIRYLRSQE